VNRLIYSSEDVHRDLEGGNRNESFKEGNTDQYCKNDEKCADYTG
jgi:hypothetical protein